MPDWNETPAVRSTDGVLRESEGFELNAEIERTTTSTRSVNTTLDLWDEPLNVKRTVRRIADKAQVIAGSTESAELGSAIHAWTEVVDHEPERLDTVPTQFKPFITSYMRETTQRA